jgi:hypothetical protein
MMSLKSKLSTSRDERHDSRPYVLQLKPLGAASHGNFDRRPRSMAGTLASRVEQVPFLARFAVINLVGVALLAAVWAEGLLLKPYRADESGMCYLITFLFVVGLVAVARKDWQTVRWTGNRRRSSFTSMLSARRSSQIKSSSNWPKLPIRTESKTPIA